MRTRHFLQVPWPPQVESMATPFQDAASNTVTPGGTRTSTSFGAKRQPDAAAAVARRPVQVLGPVDWRPFLMPAPACA